MNLQPKVYIYIKPVYVWLLLVHICCVVSHICVFLSTTHLCAVCYLYTFCMFS